MNRDTGQLGQTVTGQAKAAFLEVQLGPDGAFRPWQEEFISRPLEEQVNQILQLPPGSGKTLLAQWIMIEHLQAHPEDRVLFGVPLRVLAKQLHDDIQATLDAINPILGTDYTVSLAEGPGARVDFKRNTVVVATYEHAAGELRRVPDLEAEDRYNVGLVVVDEIHNIAKADRGIVIDDILFFAQQRKNALMNLRFSRDPQLALIPGASNTVAVLGMSGTLEDWVSSRLLNAYALFENIQTPKSLGIEQQEKPHAARIYLDEKKFDFVTTARLARSIVKDLLGQRVASFTEAWNEGKEPDTTQWKRLVAFFSSVAEAEAAFAYVATDPEVSRLAQELAELAARFPVETPDGDEIPYYVAPKLKFANSLEKIFGRTFKDEALKPHARVLADHEAPYRLMGALNSAGIYVHHAQLKGQEATETQLDWRDALQQQLAYSDFVAVFCTSTLSVGVNLNSTQIGILGPNTMWSIDQAEQMIGRVGRVDRDAADSVVFVVGSSKYLAPGSNSLAVPSAWFVPRLIAAVEFYQAFGLTGTSNLNIRGFFRPVGAPDEHLPDSPGGTAKPIALEWGLITEQTVEVPLTAGTTTTRTTAEISPTAGTALALCRQDLKSLPCTDFILTNRTTDMWLVLLWALLVAKLPAKWTQIPGPETPADAPGSRALAKGPLRAEPAVGTLLKLYGESHALYPGDPDTPSEASAASVLNFFNRFVWCAMLYPDQWPNAKEADPVELFQIVQNVLEVLETSLEESNSILQAAVTRAGEADLTVGDLRNTDAAFREAKAFTEMLMASITSVGVRGGLEEIRALAANRQPAAAQPGRIQLVRNATPAAANAVRAGRAAGGAGLTPRLSRVGRAQPQAQAPRVTPLRPGAELIAITPPVKIGLLRAEEVAPTEALAWKKGLEDVAIAKGQRA